MPDFFKSTESLNNALTNFIDGRRYFVLADENSAGYCLPHLQLDDAINLFIIDAGEQSKSLSGAEYLWQKLIESKARRNDVFINLGGGMITDLGGFVASSYKRGMPFINIPTTLLCMVDAAIGGKTGVNFLNYKNQIGSFSKSEYCLIFPGFLKSLSEEELLSGYAEMIKHALIADEYLFYSLSKSAKPEYSVIAKNLKRAIAVKEQIANEDPQEKSKRKLLNFGHTAGHAIESWYWSNNKKISHGRAVAYGMQIECDISAHISNFPAEQNNLVQSYLGNIFGSPLFSKSDIEEISEIAIQDKKNTDSRLNFSLLDTIGQASFDHHLSPDEFKEFLNKVFCGATSKF